MIIKIKENKKLPNLFNYKAWNRSKRIVNPLTGKPYSLNPATGEPYERIVYNEGRAVTTANSGTVWAVFYKKTLADMEVKNPAILKTLLSGYGFDLENNVESFETVDNYGESVVYFLQSATHEKINKIKEEVSDEN